MGSIAGGTADIEVLRVFFEWQCERIEDAAGQITVGKAGRTFFGGRFEEC